MPAMGESVTEGVVAQWVRGVGDAVVEGEPVVEVTTDKVDIEVPAPATGTLTAVEAKEGDTVPVGGVLGRIAPGGRRRRRPHSDGHAEVRPSGDRRRARAR